MLSLLLHLHDLLEDARLRRAAKRYQAQLKVIDSLLLPDDFKKAARDQALNHMGQILERYAASS